MLSEMNADSKVKIPTRMDFIKRLNTISSSKGSLTKLSAVMLLLRMRMRAESRDMVVIFEYGGLAYTSVMMVVLTIFNIYYFHVTCKIMNAVRNVCGNMSLTLDYTEVYYYFSLHRLRCNKWLATTLRLALDIVIILQKFGKSVCCLLFALREISSVANKYGNDYSETSLCWYALIPVSLLLLIGNYNMLSIMATVGNGLALVTYGNLFADYVTGIGQISKRKLGPSDMKDAIITMGLTFEKSYLSYAALSIRNEMKSEASFDDAFGALNVTFLILNLMHLILPGMCYIKYGSSKMDIMSANRLTLELIHLVVGLEQLLAIAIHIYVPFHVVFPVICRTVGPKKVLRLEIILKLLIAVAIVAATYLTFSINLTIVVSIIFSPLLCVALPALYQLLEGTHGTALKMANVIILFLVTFQILFSAYYWFR